MKRLREWLDTPQAVEQIGVAIFALVLLALLIDKLVP